MINNPIILDENGNLLFFNSKDIAELYIEPEDVKNNEYIAYDSEGRLLKLELIEYEKTGFLGLSKSIRVQVNIVSTEDFPNHSNELKRKLTKFLHKISPSYKDEEDYMLQDILQKVIELSGYSI